MRGPAYPLRVSTLAGDPGVPGTPRSLIPQPLGQLAVPASSTAASAVAETSRYQYLRALIGLPPFRPIAPRNVTTGLYGWQFVR